MSAQLHDEDYVLHKVTRALLKQPQSMGELAAVFDFDIQASQLDEALDILEESGALNERQEPRQGSLIPVYEIRKDRRTSTAVERYKALLRS